MEKYINKVIYFNFQIKLGFYVKLHYIYNESLVFAVMFQLNIIIYS